MIGRADELARARSSMRIALGQGRGGCVLVTGEAGIGKTRLVTHALARAGLPVLHGRRTGVGHRAVRARRPGAAAVRAADAGPARGVRALHAVPRAAAAGDRRRRPRTPARRRSSRRCCERSLELGARGSGRGRARRPPVGGRGDARACCRGSPPGSRDVPLLLVAVTRDEVPGRHASAPSPARASCGASASPSSFR